MSKKIKVCIPMYSFYSYYGGSEKQAEKLSLELSKLGIEVTIITAKTTNAEKKIPEEFTVKLLPYPYKGTSRILRKISSFTFMIELFFYLLLNSSKYDILKTFFIDKYSLMTVLAGLITKKPVIMLEQNLKKYENPNIDLKNDFLHQTLYKIYKKGALFVAISDEIREEFEQTFDIPAEIIRSIPNGVEAVPVLEKQATRNKLSFPDDKKICLMVGRLSYQKNHIQLFRAWSILKDKMPEAVLYCLGEGDKRSELEQFIKNNKCENNIILAGTKDNVHEYLNVTDFFFLPSHFEGMPNALIEAMSAGLPIIASKINAHTLIVEHEHNALLFDLSLSDEEIADFIYKSLNNPELAQKIGHNAKIKAEEFAIDKIAKKYYDFYNELIES